MTNEMTDYHKELRKALANYFASEGCSCCRGNTHNEDRIKLAKLTGMSLYEYKSGVDYFKYLPKRSK